MKDLLQRLGPKEQRGSKPRCHLLTHGPAEEVAARLTALIDPFAQVSTSDRWMPQGFDQLAEAQLHKPSRLLDPVDSERLADWWLAPASRRAKTPHFDIASTCTIVGKQGLLLVEAKAHDRELLKEVTGRSIGPGDSEDRKVSHETITAAIASANAGLEQATILPWSISRESHYQISNRFAWAWKLTELGYPVVLVYLGFLRADEMVDQGRTFADHGEWESVVKSHTAEIVPPEAWGKVWTCNGQTLIPLIRSMELSLDPDWLRENRYL